MRTILAVGLCLATAGIFAGCSGRVDTQAADVQATDADVYLTVSDAPKEQMSEVALEPVAVSPAQWLPWVPPNTIELAVGGDSASVAYSNYSAPVGNYVRYKFRTAKNKVYVEELSARRWEDDPDIYASRSSSVSPSNYTWCSRKLAHFPDTGGFKSGTTGWCYLAISAYSGTGGECQWRIRVYTGAQ